MVVFYERGYMQTDYNGSTHLITKIEELLGAKKLSTSAAVRMLLESQLHNIKARHDMAAQIEDLRLKTQKDIEEMKVKTQVDIELLKRTSFGLKIYTNPRTAIIIFFILYSFAISDIREPVVGWLLQNIKIFLSIL